MMLGDERGKFRVGRSINEKVRQPIGAGFDGGLCILKRANVHHGEFAALMRCRDYRRHDLLADGWYGDPIGLAIVVNDLDVVRAFGYACVDESLRLVRRRDGWDGHAVFGAVAVRRGDQGARAAQVSQVKLLAVGLVFLHLSGIAMVREDIELSGYAKDERVFQSIAKRVRVSVNQTGQERLPFAVDAADAGRS